MLVLLTGPSGSGKTTTIRVGSNSCSWLVIETFTTRPARGDFDSKTQISESDRRNFEKNFGNYLITNYAQHLYINRLSDLRHAAQEDVVETYVVDWVHKYPIPLEQFGPRAVGIVLCPTLKELHARLERVGRLPRFESSRGDFWNIRRERPNYPPNWKVISSTQNPRSMATRISKIVSNIFTC